MQDLSSLSTRPHDLSSSSSARCDSRSVTSRFRARRLPELGWPGARTSPSDDFSPKGPQQIETRTALVSEFRSDD